MTHLNFLYDNPAYQYHFLTDRYDEDSFFRCFWCTDLGFWFRDNVFPVLLKTDIQNFFVVTSYDLDPRAYHTVWGVIIGGSISRMSVWAVGQTTVQRAVAAKSLKDAKL